MWLSPSLLVLLLIMCSTVQPHRNNQIKTFSFEKEEEARESLTSGRRRRSVLALARAMLEGYKATNNVLKGARKITSTKFVTRYYKTGSYKEALEDFESAKPIQVRHFVFPDADAKIGVIGDRAIVIKSDSEFGVPVLKIFKPNRLPNKDGEIATTLEIVYQ